MINNLPIHTHMLIGANHLWENQEDDHVNNDRQYTCEH